MEQSLPTKRVKKVPWVHLMLGVSGWIAYVFLPSPVMMVAASVLSLLALPRFIRGPREFAEQRIAERLRQHHQPSKRSHRQMLPEEEFLLEVREHPIGLFWWWLAGTAWTAAALAIGIYFSWAVASIFWGSGMLVLWIRLVLWRLDRICLTDKRIFAVHGLFTLKLTTIPLKKVTDKAIVIPWHSTILTWLRITSTEYGVVRLETAGEGNTLTNIVYVPHTIEITNLLLEKALD